MTPTSTQPETKHHVLHVTVDEDGERDYSITCPHDPDDMSRRCVSWSECRHPFSDADWDRLHDIDEEPCPEGEDGIAHHKPVHGMVCHPTRLCFPATSDYMVDAANDLDLPAGNYPVDCDAEDFLYPVLSLIDEPATVSRG